MLLVEDLCEDDWIKNVVDKSAKNLATAPLIPIKLLSGFAIFTGMSTRDTF